MEKKVRIKYNNSGYFREGELKEIWGVLEGGLANLKARKASGFWVIVEGAPKEDGLLNILKGLKERNKGEVTIGFSGYSPQEIVDTLSSLPYEVNIEARKFLG